MKDEKADWAWESKDKATPPDTQCFIGISVIHEPFSQEEFQ